MKTKAFTLVELIVVITILAILGTIAFISLQGYSKDARDVKRISDVRNLLTKINVEQSLGTPPEELIINTTERQGQILGISNTQFQTMGEVNFENINEKQEDFQDPSNNKDYYFAYAKGGTNTGSYNFIQGATISETQNTTKILGNYYTNTPGDAPSLFMTGSNIYYEEGQTPIYDVNDGNNNIEIVKISCSSEFTSSIQYKQLSEVCIKHFPNEGLIAISDGNGGGYVMKDKNEGATDVGIDGTDYKIIGNYYQWGNNFGFPSENEIYSNLSALNGRITVTSIDENSNYTGIGLFTIVNTNPINWAKASSQNILNNLWGGLATGTIQEKQLAQKGPCPDGFHLPTADDWTNIHALGGWGEDGMQMINDLLLPAAGGRNQGDGVLSLQGTRGNYWSSSTTLAYPNAATCLNFYDDSISATNNGNGCNRARANSVRCFKNQ